MSRRYAFVRLEAPRPCNTVETPPPHFRKQTGLFAANAAHGNLRASAPLREIKIGMVSRARRGLSKSTSRTLRHSFAVSALNVMKSEDW